MLNSYSVAIRATKEFQQAQDELEHKLANRPSRGDLVSHNIMKGILTRIFSI